MKAKARWGLVVGLAFLLGGDALLAEEKEKKDGNVLIEVMVKGVALQPMTNAPVMVLVDKEKKKALPIWIGLFEARAIAAEMEHMPLPGNRPQTHDLIKNLLDGLKAKVGKVTINDLHDGTFYAMISVMLNGAEIHLDSRPSDAIALAIRVKSPVYVARKVMDGATTIELTPEKLKDEDKNWRKWLEDLKPTPSDERKLEL